MKQRFGGRCFFDALPRGGIRMTGYAFDGHIRVPVEIFGNFKDIFRNLYFKVSEKTILNIEFIRLNDSNLKVNKNYN